MLSDSCSVMSVCPVCDVGVFWPNGWTDQDETWCACRPWPWPHCVRRVSSSPQKGGTAPQFSAHFCCGQMVGWIKMPLGTEVGLGSLVIFTAAIAIAFAAKGIGSFSCRWQRAAEGIIQYYRQAQIGIWKTLSAGDAACQTGRDNGSAESGRSQISTVALFLL